MFRCVSRAGAMSTPIALSAIQHQHRCFVTKDEHGHTIYKSNMASALPEIDKYTNLYTYMRNRWEEAPQDRLCVLQAETNKQLLFGEMGPATDKMAQVLYHEGGVRKGDTVTIAMLNTVLYPLLCYGSMQLGATVSTVNAVSAPDTLAYYLKSTNSKVLLAMKFFQKNAEEAVEMVFKETGHKVKIMYPDTFLSMPGQEAIPADYKPLESASVSDTVLIPFSSGSTGMPKGVQLTNRSLISNLTQCTIAMPIESHGSAISILPFFHIFGFTCSLNCVMAQHVPQVIMMKYSAGTFIDMIEKHKVSFALVAPPILVSLVKNKDKLKSRDISSLVALRSGSAPLTPEMERECEELLGCSVGQGYGMTEMAPVVTALPIKFDKSKRIYGSSGELFPDTELRVVEIDSSQQSGEEESAGVDAKPGETGEIWFRGPQIFKGYLKDEDTVKAMAGDWYRSGDIGHYDDAAGHLIITDRLKELIKYKGFQVSPAALEGVLLQHPWVQDCLVIGVPDPRDVSFENPRALVVLKKNLKKADRIRASDELMRYVMQECPPEKRLHGGVRIVASLERNMAGKIMRRQIRQSEIAYLKGVADGTIKPGEPTMQERLKTALANTTKTTSMVGIYARLVWHIQKEKFQTFFGSKKSTSTENNGKP